ncbi:MAG TPA: hypothetical protein DCE41_12530 [Cytophagales bacterium]|nr:hypothetical protein [Cytophagales bacterium]HAA18578.1 hypothetical protein [Cytophagales bacterium]HAP63117.1 hypothetical protein [Cytophagales bacterium]
MKGSKAIFILFISCISLGFGLYLMLARSTEEPLKYSEFFSSELKGLEALGLLLNEQNNCMPTSFNSGPYSHEFYFEIFDNDGPFSQDDILSQIHFLIGKNKTKTFQWSLENHEKVTGVENCILISENDSSLLIRIAFNELERFNKLTETHSTITHSVSNNELVKNNGRNKSINFDFLFTTNGEALIVKHGGQNQNKAEFHVPNVFPPEFGKIALDFNEGALELRMRYWIRPRLK